MLDGEKALAHPHLTVAAASGAGLRLGAGLGAAAVADFALFMRRDADLLLATARGFFQRDFHVVAQVRAAIDVGAPAAAAGASAAEDVAEDICEIAEASEARAAASASLRVHPGVAELVVRASLLAVRQNLVGFLDLFELLFRFLAVRVAIRVILHRQLAVSLFDVVVGGVAIDAQHIVVIFLGHVPVSLKIQPAREASPLRGRPPYANDRSEPRNTPAGPARSSGVKTSAGD